MNLGLFLSLLTVAANGSEPVSRIQKLDQGISDSVLRQFLKVDMQSEFFPYNWLVALEQPSSSESFWTDEHVDSLGLVPAHRTGVSDSPLPVGLARNDNPSPKKLVVPYLAAGVSIDNYRERIDYIKSAKSLPKAKDGLYQGFTGDDIKGPAQLKFSTAGVEYADRNYQPIKSWAAMNCLFCHSGQIDHGQTGFLVWGGPAQVNRMAFFDRLCESLIQTIQEQEKFSRFAGKVLPANASDSDRNELRAQLKLQTQGLLGFVSRNYPSVEYGFARMDAFTMLHNEITGTMLSAPENFRIPDAPVSYANIWNAPKLSWYQWNSCVNQPLIRNCVEAMGAFGRTTVEAVDGKAVYTSTTDIKTLKDIWDWVADIKSPAWPENVLGKIDADSATRGKLIYQRENCAKCHGDKPPYPLEKPNSLGHQFDRTVQVPLKEIGTDPRQATNFATRTAYTKATASMFGGKSETAAAQILADSGVQVMILGFEKYKLTKQQQAEWSGYAVAIPPSPEHLMTYKGRDLSGIWATSPFLHNGSVPNLYQLLLPPEQRVKKFRVGSRQFDAKYVGLESSLDGNGTLLDTSLPGNSNAGHDYGTDVSEQERMDLIEYLKTM